MFPMMQGQNVTTDNVTELVGARSAQLQAGYQAAGLGCTLATALVGGIITGDYIIFHEFSRFVLL